MPEQQFEAPAAAFAQDKKARVPGTRARACCMRLLAAGQPTNQDTLIFRTVNSDFLPAPNHNDDFLAPMLRDKLMPVRSWGVKHVPLVRRSLLSLMESRQWGIPGILNLLDARTKWVDQAVTGALAAGIKQVVIVAAGFDTRPYRLAPSDGSVRFFEVDLPHESARKRKLVNKLQLAKGPLPTYVAADLSMVDLGAVLLPAGFNPTEPALFTVEGLLYYLPQEAALALMGRITQLACPGSKVVFDFLHAAALAGCKTSLEGYQYAGYKVAAATVAGRGEVWRFALEDSPQAVASFLAAAAGVTDKDKGSVAVNPTSHTIDLKAVSSGSDMRAAAPSPAKASCLQLEQHLGPKGIVALTLPHLAWSDKQPPISSFFSYVTAAMH
ncbi:S-adenosyl-L-methionine-dependent methyltransferase [Haematococcus lacustris]